MPFIFAFLLMTALIQTADKKGESSISSQRNILLNYIQKNQESVECIVEEFCEK